MNLSKSKDLKEVCSMIIKTCAGLSEGEEVLLLIDESTNREIIEAVLRTIDDCNAVACKIDRSTPKRPHDLPPSPVIWSFKGADLIIDLSKYDITHTLPMRVALFDYGARLINLTGKTPEDLLRPNIADIDYEEIDRQARRLVDVLESGKTFRYISPKGTNLIADITNRSWYILDAMAKERGVFSVFPIGEILGSAVHGSANGKVVIEFLALFGKLKTPITMTVENSWVTKLEGGEEADKLRDMWAKVENANYVGELGGIGLNPLNAPADRIDALEVMMKLGCAHIGFGDSLDFGQRISSEMHLNGTMLDVTIEVDGKPVIAENKILI